MKTNRKKRGCHFRIGREGLIKCPESVIYFFFGCIVFSWICEDSTLLPQSFWYRISLYFLDLFIIKISMPYKEKKLRYKLVQKSKQGILWKCNLFLLQLKNIDQQSSIEMLCLLFKSFLPKPNFLFVSPQNDFFLKWNYRTQFLLYHDINYI